MSQESNFRSLFRGVAWLAALLAAASAQAAPCLSGHYDGGAMEVAAELDLEAGGRFHYALAYGALDEEAMGRWESDGASVFLTSDPITPPRFSLVGQGTAPKEQFRLTLDLPRGLSRQFFDVRLTLADGTVSQHQLGDDGLILPLKPRQKVVAAQLLLSVFELESQTFALAGGGEARFRFEPNDLGKAVFTRAPLRIDGGDLLLERYDRELRFRHDDKACRE